MIQRAAAEVPSGSVVTLPKDTRVNVVELAEAQLPTPGITLGHRDGREVFWLPPSELTRIPLHAGTGALIPLIVGGVFPDDIKKSEVYIVGGSLSSTPTAAHPARRRSRSTGPNGNGQGSSIGRGRPARAADGLRRRRNRVPRRGGARTHLGV